MLRYYVLLVATMYICTLAVAGITPVADAVGLAVADKQETLVPDQVRLGGYLGDRIALNESKRLLVVDEDELLEGFRHRPGKQEWCGEHIGKWLHAATLAWVNTGDPALRAKLDRVAAELLKCQDADGYLGTYLPSQRWTMWDVWVHKYNLIGLLTYYKYTGNTAALQGAQRIGDLLCATFGKPPARDLIAAGTHMGMAATSVLEPMALLYRQTGAPRYLAFCRYIVASWEKPDGPHIISSLLKYRAVNRVANGKAYEMLSNLVGLCELYRTTGDPALLQPVLYAWEDIVARRLYITGSASAGEHFQADHDLPNSPDRNLCETCVTVTWLQLNLQLLHLTGEARFADEIERTTYNHLLGAQKPTGDQWCYYTALEGKKPYSSGTSCCVSSGPRGVSLLPTMAFCATREGVVCNLYGTASVKVLLKNGESVQIEQKSRYPFEEKVRFLVRIEHKTRFVLALRIPSWCREASLAGAGTRAPYTLQPGEYCRLDREWQDGDRLELHLRMPLRVAVGEHSNAGQIAVTYGPLVLSADETHNPNLKPLHAVSLSATGAEAVRTDDNTWVLPGTLIGRTAAGGKPGDRVRITLLPFAEAGGDRSRYQVWFPQTGIARAQAGSALAFGAESWSREGNVDGNIADDDPHTYRVTFNGQQAEEDWYAVELARPVQISRISFTHGHCFHDGGWFDASAGKPRVQIKRTSQGPWETIASLDTYPDTTATDAKGLQDGQVFSVHFTPVEVFGIRIIGKPACGDSPSQAFSSCAELQGLEK